MMPPPQPRKKSHPASERLAKLRAAMRDAGIDAYLVPRADKFQSGMIAPQDERLAWLTGFTGSAGCLAATARSAALEVDGRYDVQARLQTAEDIELLVGRQEKLPGWITRSLPPGSAAGFDPWLHTRRDVRRIGMELLPNGIELRSVAGLVDRIWTDRPDAPTGPAWDYPIEYAGERREEKIERMSRELRKAGAKSAILTRPESIAWLLNIRGSDVDCLPIVQAYAVLADDCRVEVFADPSKFDADLVNDLKPAVRLRPFEIMPSALRELSGRTLVDPFSAPERIFELLEEHEVRTAKGVDPCIKAKAIKNKIEIENHRTAQERDGVAVAKFLAWIDRSATTGAVTETEAAAELERLRRSSGKLKGLSFATIAASGPHGAIIHYHPTAETNRRLESGDLFLVDSGGQYLDGTTDVTRTVVIGEPTEDQSRNYTCVLKGLIALSTAKWPPDRTGRDLDTIARYPLWLSGQDFEHGTGHGVGHFLGVHEGPQSISRRSGEPLVPGMIVSLEPGLYLEGCYGIRLENLALVAACSPENSDSREFLRLETLTFAPFDKRLIDASKLSPDERHWLNQYHSSVLAKIGPHLADADLDWLEQSCAAIC